MTTLWEDTLADIRTNGHDTKAELERHLLELAEDLERDHDSEVYDDNTEANDVDAVKREISWLRKEVYDLREQLMAIQPQAAHVEEVPVGDKPWLRIAATVAVTFLLGKLVQRMRLGAPGAAAVPLIAAQINRRL